MFALYITPDGYVDPLEIVHILYSVLGLLAREEDGDVIVDDVTPDALDQIHAMMDDIVGAAWVQEII